MRLPWHAQPLRGVMKKSSKTRTLIGPVRSASSQTLAKCAPMQLRRSEAVASSACAVAASNLKARPRYTESASSNFDTFLVYFGRRQFDERTTEQRSPPALMMSASLATSKPEHCKRLLHANFLYTSTSDFPTLCLITAKTFSMHSRSSPTKVSRSSMPAATSQFSSLSNKGARPWSRMPTFNTPSTSTKMKVCAPAIAAPFTALAIGSTRVEGGLRTRLSDP
mmetsp:Transcript_34615/g.98525  ORF Transcript_34615/g.98525 Transcript_34615/m.98525 type:complete len:223 (+) Transcript_34615:330-998(+)